MATKKKKKSKGLYAKSKDTRRYCIRQSRLWF